MGSDAGVIGRTTAQSRRNPFPYYLVLAYLFFEYGRPQAIFKPLEVLHLPAIIVILLVGALAQVPRLFQRHHQTTLFIALLVLMAVHIPIATNNFWAFHIARTMLITFVAYLGIVVFINSTEKFNALIFMWLVIHGYLAISGIIKGGRGVGGFMGDENDLCLVLNMAIPFPLFLALHETNKTRKILYFALTLLLFATVVATVSRGGFIGLAAVGGYCWWRSKKKVVMALAVVTLAGFMFLIAPSTYWDEIASIRSAGEKHDTGGQRLYTWKIGWAMFLDNPILGVGQGNFPFVFREYEIATGNEKGFYGRSIAGRAAHSLYFTVLPEWGLVGTTLFGLMAWRTYKDVRFLRRVRMPSRELNDKMTAWSSAMEGSLVAYFVSGVFISVFYYPCFWTMMGFIGALKNIVIVEQMKTRLQVAGQTT